MYQQQLSHCGFKNEESKGSNIFSSAIFNADEDVEEGHCKWEVGWTA